MILAPSPRPRALILAIAALLLTPTLAAAAEGEATTEEEAPIRPYPEAFVEVVSRLEAEMNATIPDLIARYNATRPQQVLEIQGVVAAARVLMSKDQHGFALETLRLLPPLVARLELDAEVDATGADIVDAAKVHSERHNETTHALARETHQKVLDAQRKVTTTRGMDLVLAAGYYLAEGEAFLDNYNLFRGRLAAGDRNNLTIQGALSWASGPSVSLRVAQGLAAEAIEADAEGTVPIRAGGWSTIGTLSYERARNLGFQPYQWYSQELNTYQGTEEHAYVAGLYVITNATITDSQLRTQGQKGITTYSQLRAKVQGTASTLERYAGLIEDRDPVGLFTIDALNYHDNLARAYGRVKDNSTEALRYAENYYKAANLLNRANDANLFFLAGAGLATPAGGTPVTTQGNDGSFSVMQIVVAAVAGAAAAAAVTAIVLTRRKS